ncbi:hypothetical protein [Fusobacterium sp.]|uniref:hypothetical protein n=1 Tax=Fusobacterium sp. TaxID=68766 RepID=UPI002636D249|nr:hypothetical protein [Fusobacterium sp.]
MEIIFVAGINGVGKGQFFRRLKDNIPFYSSTELINKYRENNSVNEDNALINSLSQLDKDKIYLSGHFCFVDGDYNIVRTPIERFKSLNIKKIIILYTEYEIIAMRLIHRSDRFYTSELIKEFQRKEMEYGIEVANLLNIEYEIVRI